ncbi:K(+)/H(+) antiporter NhaP2 [Andreprevotia sp. IGB-42]|uniref:cation:proton antiporter n=1 Tax=Andreprevotia sp. IGB-42 TaxID=2497473 RepID=UPI00157E39B4|nr:cation:proton antiporter [Andreprevotia sp. IGB-42]KAF0813348.1 K(+)/H(+) antiporter NhaP2 [Andreprevotia sp. IGB-42]
MESGAFAWALIGACLLAMVMVGHRIRYLPISIASLYLVLGYAAGPGVMDWVRIDPIRQNHILLFLCEIALVLSLFSAGLKLRLPMGDVRWQIAFRLALPTLAISIVLLALAGKWLLGLAAVPALLLASMLAPTDPALASDVQVQNAGDADQVRFSLTGEAGLNDGVAMPFVLLGLGLLTSRYGQGLEFGKAWLLQDLLFGVVGGIVLGWLLGELVGRGVPFLRSHHAALGREEFIALGTICLTYGVATLLHCNGFIAVFVAGAAVRRIEHRSSSGRAAPQVIGSVESGKEEEVATHPDKASAYMAQEVLAINEQLEHMAEFAMVFIVGVLLSAGYWSWSGALLAAVLFLVVRPVSVYVGLMLTPVTRTQRRLISWFGIRGVSSLFYVSYAIGHGLPQRYQEPFLSAVLTVVGLSILCHGISATPLMNLNERINQRYRPASRSFPHISRH